MRKLLYAHLPPVFIEGTVRYLCKQGVMDVESWLDRTDTPIARYTLRHINLFPNPHVWARCVTNVIDDSHNEILRAYALEAIPVVRSDADSFYRSIVMRDDLDDLMHHTALSSMKSAARLSADTILHCLENELLAESTVGLLSRSVADGFDVRFAIPALKQVAENNRLVPASIVARLLSLFDDCHEWVYKFALKSEDDKEKAEILSCIADHYPLAKVALYDEAIQWGNICAIQSFAGSEVLADILDCYKHKSWEMASEAVKYMTSVVYEDKLLSLHRQTGSQLLKRAIVRSLSHFSYHAPPLILADASMFVDEKVTCLMRYDNSFDHLMCLAENNQDPHHLCHIGVGVFEAGYALIARKMFSQSVRESMSDPSIYAILTKIFDDADPVFAVTTLFDLKIAMAKWEMKNATHASQLNVLTLIQNEVL